MEYRKIGDTNLKASAIGFGTFELNREYGPVDDQEVVRAIFRGLDLGVTCIDVAPIYGFGRAEEIVGRALGPRRKEVVLVTKCGIRWAEGGKRVWDGSRASILREIDESLERLRTDYVDLYLVHYSPARLGTPMEETIAALEEVRTSGRARYIGVSNYDRAELQQALALGPIVANQIVYNLFDRRNEDCIDFGREHGVSTMAHGSLSSGLLVGNVTAETHFGEDDWRRSGMVRGLPLMAPDNLPTNVAVVERLKAVARSLGVTMPQLAVNWVLGHPGVAVALTGCRRTREIEENVGAVGWSLSPEDKARIDAIMQDAAGTNLSAS
ncbi:MAG: aldo/keto reductase [Anaerolineae bacterium]|nr:aldo/keto reductase [Anaerolineae bacterium]